MTLTQLTRSRARTAAAAALCGIAAISVAACSPVPNPDAGQTTAPAGTAAPAASTAAGAPVVIDCAGQARTRPAQYVLACGDGAGTLAGLRWAGWGPSSATADGISVINDCAPSCVAGHGHQFPALVRLWRAEPLPGHPGERYFTRLTITYTGTRSYRADGQLRQLPKSTTYPLFPTGGA